MLSDSKPTLAKHIVDNEPTEASTSVVNPRLTLTNPPPFVLCCNVKLQNSLSYKLMSASLLVSPDCPVRSLIYLVTLIDR